MPPLPPLKVHARDRLCFATLVLAGLLVVAAPTFVSAQTSTDSRTPQRLPHPKPSPTPAPYVDPLWTGTNSSSWTDPGNWSPAGVPTATDDVTFSGTPTNFPDQPAGTTILHSITFSAGAAAFTGLNTSGEIFALQDSATFTAFTQASSNLQTINQLDVYLTSATASQTATINLSGTGGLTLSEGLRWGTGATASTQQFIIQGPGSLIVNGTFRGDLTTAGATGGTSRRIFLNGDATSGQSVTFNPTSSSTWTGILGITIGGHVTLNLANAAALDAGDIVFASGSSISTLFITGASGSTLDRNISFTGGSITGGVQTIGVNGVSATFSGNVSLAGTANDIVLWATVPNTATFSGGVISGSHALLMSGGGTVVMSGANTFSGKFSIANGTVKAGSLNSVTGGTASSNLGAPTTAANGTIDFGSSGNTGQFTYTGIGETTDRVINLAGTTGGAILDQSGTGLLKFTGVNTATGLGSKTLTLQGSTAGTGEISGAIVDNSGTNKTSVTKTGTGTWTLSGTNTYTGSTSVQKGSLGIGNDSALGPALATNFLLLGGFSGSDTPTIFASGGARTIANNIIVNAPTIGTATIAGSNDLTVNGTLTETAGSRTLTVNNTGLTTFAGNVYLSDASFVGFTLTINGTGNTLISGSIANYQLGSGSAGSLAKSGTGTLTLTNTNTYTGTTTINQGTLLVNGSTNAGSAVTVNSTGTLGGTGTVNGTVDVKSGGTLSPGTSPGILHTGAVTLEASSTYLVDVNGGSGPSATGAGTLYDQTIVNGSISLAGNLSLTLGVTPLVVGDKFFIALSNGTVTGTFANTTGGGTIYQQGPDFFLVNYADSAGDGTNLDDISLTVTAVPEPSTWMGGSLALAALAFSQRRRLKRLLVES